MNQKMTPAISIALILALVPSFVPAGNEEIWGTYKIVCATVHWLDNGQTEDAYGKHPNGYISYGKDGRMMVLVAFDGRLKLSKPETATIEQRDQLYSTMFAYAPARIRIPGHLSNTTSTCRGMRLGPARL